MIFCHDKIYAKVWKVTKSDKYLDLRVSTSEKSQDGSYINSTWFPRVIGHAFNSLKDTLKDGDLLVITKSKFSNEQYTAKDGSAKSAFKFLVFEGEIAGNNTSDNTKSTSTPSEHPAQSTTENEDENPW